MVNKRGWVRIIEAGMGILIIIGALLIIANSKKTYSEPDISYKLSGILEEISQNSALRNSIITDDEGAKSQVEDFIEEKMNGQELDYDIEICDANDECSSDRDTGTGDVWSSERIISINIDNINQYSSPKKLMVYAWRK